MEPVVWDKRTTFPRSTDEIIEFVLTSSSKQEKMLKSRPEDALVKLVKLVNIVKLVKQWRLY